LLNKEKDNDLKESKILNQEKDIDMLSRNLDDKNKEYAIIKDKLEQKAILANKLSNERNSLFNELEGEKFETNKKIMGYQREFNKCESEADRKIADWQTKHNSKEQELENVKIK
jgi:hypothetical protein